MSGKRGKEKGQSAGQFAAEAFGHQFTEPGCDCVELRELALLFVDGELEPEARRRVLIHIQECRNCARLVRSLKRTVHFCHLETDWVVPEQAHRRLWERLEMIVSKQGFRRKRTGK
ncbi:MAG: anti-sigma factor family protein [candidate division WOR-3 bacterium]